MSIWEQWEGLLRAETPDLLAILKLGAQLQAYFAAVEREDPSSGASKWAHLGSVGRSGRNESASCMATSHDTISAKPPYTAR